MDINNLSDDDYQRMYINKRTEYFKKYFSTNSLEVGLYEIIKNGTITLLRTYLKLKIICECVEIVKDNETFNNMTAAEVDDIYNGLKSMCDDIENIINNIVVGFEL